MNRFPRRKLTFIDGEYILHHAIEHLYNFSDISDADRSAMILCGKDSPCEFCRAIVTCKTALIEVQAAVQS